MMTLEEALNELDTYFEHWDAPNSWLTVKTAARLVANGKEVWLCGDGGVMRPGKPPDLSCIFAKGHFPGCGRYLQVALTPGDTDE